MSSARESRNVLPNLPQSVVVGPGQMGNFTPAEMLKLFPRTGGSMTLTVGGTITDGDVLNVRIESGSLNEVVEVPVASGDTTTTAATKLATGLNANLNLRAAGYVATSAAAVVTLSGVGAIALAANYEAWAESATGNPQITIGGTVTAGEKDVIRFSNEDLPGGKVVISILAASTTTARATALKNAINANLTLKALGLTATSSGALITLAADTDTAGTTIVSYAWQPAKTVTVGGTPAEGNAPVLTITNASLPGGNTPITYTVLVTDTTTALVAEGLKNAINANSEMIGAGITATRSGAVVSIVVPEGIGAVTYAKTDDNTTLTLGAVPTETLALAGASTETIAMGSYSGGGGPIIPVSDFRYVHNGYIHTFKAGQPTTVAADLLSALLRDKMPIS